MLIQSTRGLLMLLSVVAVVTGFQLEASIVNAENATIPPHQNISTPIATFFKSSTEERSGSPLSRIDMTHSLAPPTSSLQEKLLSLLQRAVPSRATAVLLKDVKHVTDPAVQAKAVSQLFDHYGVGAVTSKLFESKKYQNWAGRILDSHDFSRKGHELIINQLLTNYQDKLIVLLAEATQVSTTNKISQMYENMLIDTWIRDSNGKGIDLVRTPLFQRWFELKTGLNQAPELQVFLQLPRGQFDDADAMENIANAGNSRINDILKKLSGVKPYQVEYRRLELHNARTIEALLTDKSLEEWLGYVEKANVKLGDALLFSQRVQGFSDKKIIELWFGSDSTTTRYHDSLRTALFDEWNKKQFDSQKLLEHLQINPLDSKEKFNVLMVVSDYLAQH